MTTLEEAFEQFKQLPDWDKYPMPEVFYEHFKVKKPQPSLSLMESLTYTTPPHHSLNKNGKVEIRGPAEGGVREIKEFLTLPVEQTLITDENETYMLTDSAAETLSRPTEGTTKETQPELGRQSPNPSCVAADTVPDVPCRDDLSNLQPMSPQNE